MNKHSLPSGYDEIQYEELALLFARVTRARLLAVPIVAGAVIWLAFTKITLWRWGLLTFLALFAIVLFVHEVWRFHRHGLGKRAFLVNLGSMTLGITASALATGGIESPVYLAMFPISTAAAMLVKPPILFMLVGTQVAAIWMMVWIRLGALLPNFNPTIFGGDLVPGWNHAHVIWFACFATLSLGLATFVGRSLRISFDNVLRRGLGARQEVLRAHDERAREMAAFSGEIAHELKNPLASIKGLAALLAEDAPPGKPAERLTVLRREVDRMQGILEEFLNFSRPLVPLSLETVDLHALVEEVVDMHEGSAHACGFRVLIAAGEQAVCCDQRKIKQAVVNLVQNAIEASPSGETVEIQIETGSLLRLYVRDRGVGVDPALADKVFEPGVTTKAWGSGLGLTIARGLIRQHGGELTLASRLGGGTEAIMQLPVERCLA